MSIAFVANQIAYLADQDIRVYVEVIQVIESRQTCWVRPLAWVVTHSPEDSPEVYDLSHGPDLICQISWLGQVLDTEWLPILSLLYQGVAVICDRAEAHQRLNHLLRALLPPTGADSGENDGSANSLPQRQRPSLPGTRAILPPASKSPPSGD